LNRGGNPNIQDNDGNSILHLAVMNNIQSITLLLNYDCNLSLKNNKGWTALDIARTRNYVEIIALLEAYDNFPMVKDAIDE
jgi:ankyrin repeat protein